MTRHLFLFLFLAAIQAWAQPNVTDSKGLKQGPWKKTDKDGKLEYTGTFKDNKPVGVFTYYYTSGKVKAVNIFSNGGSRARVTLYHDDDKNKVMARGVYVEQKKDSVWKLYNEDEKLVGEEVYQAGKKSGIARKYFTNGQLAEEMGWKDGDRDGSWRSYFESGKPHIIGAYKKGELDGPLTYYFPNGNKESEGTYFMGVKSGQWIDYLEDGKTKVEYEYDKGKLVREKRMNGVFTDNYPNETPKEIVTWAYGKKHGPYKKFYEGEYVRELRKGEDGFPDETIEYVKDKKLMEEGEYKDGKLSGKVTFYKNDGSVQEVKYYVNGEEKKSGTK